MTSENIHPFDGVDLRELPHFYRIGRGEYGVFHAEPYKSELLPLWRFRTAAVAQASARAIYDRFLTYRTQQDFVGMDVARKFLQMGYTRARRYAKHPDGRKYDRTGQLRPVTAVDPVKAEAAAIFYQMWQRAMEDKIYQQLKARFQANRNQYRKG